MKKIIITLIIYIICITLLALYYYRQKNVLYTYNNIYTKQFVIGNDTLYIIYKQERALVMYGDTLCVEKQAILSPEN